MVPVSPNHQTVLPFLGKPAVVLSALSPTSHLSPRSLQNEVPDTNGHEILNDNLDESEEAIFRAGTEAFLRKNIVHEIALRRLVEDLIEGIEDVQQSTAIEPCIEDQRSMVNRNIKMNGEQHEDDVQYGLPYTEKVTGHQQQTDQKHGLSHKDKVSNHQVHVLGKKLMNKSLEKKHPKGLSKPRTSFGSNVSPSLINDNVPEAGVMEDQAGIKTQNFSETEVVRKKVSEFLRKRSSQNKHNLGKEDGNAMNDHYSVLAGCDDAVLGAVFLRLSKLAISEDRSKEALSFATQAAKAYERSAEGKTILDLSMCLHVISAIHCSLGDYEEAISVLQRSLAVPDVEKGGIKHALAAFAGYMQLGDTFALLGEDEQSLAAYNAGFDIQVKALGKLDSCVGGTCRYLAEAYAKVLQFDKAEEFCQLALEIHKEGSAPASSEEFADRKLMGLICNGKGQHEAALQHLLACTTLLPNCKDNELAALNVSIGDTYTSLCQFDEAVPVYEKALTLFKMSKGENNVAVAAVYVRLAEVSLKTEKYHESKSYCQNAVAIYDKLRGKNKIEIASGLTEIAIIYEVLNEHEEKLSAMLKAIAMLEEIPGQQNTVGGIEAQIGVLHYVHGNYAEARALIGKAVTKLRSSTKDNTSLIGILLCQMGLACLQLSDVQTAVELLEESKNIVEEKYGLTYPDTLFIHSNLASAYHVLKR